MRNQNIEVTTDYNDLVIFQSTCSCGSNDHIINVCVEKSSSDDMKPLVSIYFKTSWRDQSENIFKKILGRIKAAFNVLFKGYLELDGDFMFRSYQHFQDFQSTLKEATQQIENDGMLVIAREAAKEINGKNNI